MGAAREDKVEIGKIMAHHNDLALKFRAGEKEKTLLPAKDMWWDAAIPAGAGVHYAGAPAQSMSYSAAALSGSLTS